MLVNLVTEIAYLYRHNFATVTIFGCYIFACTLKPVLFIVIVLINLKRNVIGKPLSDSESIKT